MVKVIMSDIDMDEKNDKSLNNLHDSHEQHTDNIYIIYYMAHNYYSTGVFDKAILYYKKFIHLSTQPDHSVNQILNIKSHNRIKVIDSYIKIGKSYMSQNNFEEAFKYIWTAYELSDSAHPLLIMAEYYIQYERYLDAYYLLKIASKTYIDCKNDQSQLKRNQSIDTTTLNTQHKEYMFCHTNILMSRVSEQLCEYEECHKVCESALIYLCKNPFSNIQDTYNIYKTSGNTPNRAKLLEELFGRQENNSVNLFRYVYHAYSSKPVIFFYYGVMCHKDKKWNGFSLSTPLSNRNTQSLRDSQISVILLAEELQKRQYKVIVCCDTDERLYCNDVEYIRISDYECMLRTYVIDHLVLFRYSNFPGMRVNVKNIHLWCYDNPISSTNGIYIDMNETKLKNIITSSEYHKKQLMNDVPPARYNLIRNIGYSINTAHFESDFRCKTHLQFIYSMYNDQYPDKLIQLFSKILNIYPKATLDIYLLLDDHGYKDSLLQNIDLPGIHIHNDNRRGELIKKTLTSDYWIYSLLNKDEQPHYLSVLEAQASGCICIYPNIEPLVEIIGDRGIKIDSSEDEEILSSIRYLEDNIEVKDELRQDARKWATTKCYKHSVSEWVEVFGAVDTDLKIHP